MNILDALTSKCCIMTVDNYIRQFEEIYDGPTWLGESFIDKLGPLSEAQAFEKPLPYIHSVAEVVSHVLEWRKEVLYRLQTHTRSLEMHDPLDWRDPDELKQLGWPQLKEELDEIQQSLLAFLRQKNEDWLNVGFPNEAPLTNGTLIEGLIHHDIYHLGQIGLIIRMVKGRHS